jgi:hypothetical protein
MKPLYRLTPHSRLSHNPLFALETRRVRWGDSAKALIDSSLLLMAVVCVVLVLLWLVSRLSERYPSRFNDFSLVFLAVTLLASLLLDYRCMTTAVGSINGEIAARRWDLLRLTSLDNAQIVAAKYGAAQVRVWRLMMLIVSARIAVALTVGVSTLIYSVQDTAWSRRTSGEIVSVLLGQLVVVVVAAIYLVEPFWRMRMVTALGMAISARAQQHASSVLVAIGALAALWLAQGVILAAMALGVSVIFVPLGLVEYSVNGLIFCSPLVFLIFLLAACYGFYSVVQAWGLRYAVRWAARLN